MKIGRLAMLAVMMLVVVAGCSVDIAKQMTSNEQVRTQVLDAIAKNHDLASQVVDKLMATDSTRIAMVDKMLGNSEVAKQVIVRVATNPEAIDYVIQAAVQDSAMRAHVMTLMKGIEMGSKMGKK
jgi:hypothetical protein